MTKKLRKDILQAIENFSLMDNELMLKVFEDIKCAELLLKIFLSNDKIRVKNVNTNRAVKNLQGRDVWLDILAEDEAGRLLNIEVQNDDTGAMPRRARYHLSVLDASSLPSGAYFDKLPDNKVIFITANDVLAGNLPIYHVDRTIRENGAGFSDGSEIIYVNNQIKNNTPLGLLMHDFSCKEPEKMHYKELAERTAYFKRSEEGQVKMSKVMDELLEKVNHERNVEVAKSMLAEGMSIEVVTRISKLTLEEVRTLAQKQSA